MNDANEFLLQKILSRRVAGVPRAADQVHPCYDGLSIANLPSSICRWLGCPLPVEQPLAAEFTGHFADAYRHVILIVVDGLGWEFLHAHQMDGVEDNPCADWKALLQDGQLHPLTSIVPSTTSAALTTFWTGRQPAEHGIIGYEMFLKEYSFIANIILQSVTTFLGESGNLIKAGFDPTAFLPVPTLAAHFRAHGIRPFAMQPATINGSGLSQMLLKDVATLPYRTLNELWELTAGVRAETAYKRTYTYIYWGELDTLSHQAGPQDRQVEQKWVEFTRLLARFIRENRHASKPDTLLLLTADHGQIATEVRADYDLRNHPELVEHLVMLPSGEGRLPFLFTKPGRAGAIRDYLAAHWGDQFQLIPSEKVLSSGLLGDCPPYAGTVERLGQYVVFPKDNAYWWWVNKDNRLHGRHGGLSRQEMLVPFFALEL